MKRWPGLLVLLVFVVSCGSSSASSSPSTTSASSSAHRTCGPARAITLSSDAVARVYSRGGAVYGCAHGHARSFRLGHATRSIAERRAGPIALAGTVAAYALTRFGVDTTSAEVVVRRLSDGAVLRDLPSTKIVGPESFQSVRSIVVRSDGAVAWIASDTSIIGHRRVTEVHAASGRRYSVLDSGQGIDPLSLRLRGSTLTWRDRGRTRHAKLG